MGNTFNSPQDFVKAFVDFIVLLINIITDIINIVNRYIAKILDINFKQNGIIRIVATFLKNYSTNLEFLIRQVNAMMNNIVAHLTNKAEIKEIGIYQGCENNLPSNEANEFCINLSDHNSGNTVVSLEGKFDTDIEYCMRVNYTVWDHTGVIYRNCSQLYKYNFFIKDPVTTPDNDCLIVVPELRDFEDMTCIEINGTAIPSPVRDMSLKLIYIFTKDSNIIEYDPSNVDSEIPSNATVTGIKMNVAGNIDKSDLYIESCFTDRVTVSGTLYKCKLSVPN